MTFFPKALVLQFTRAANYVYLFAAILQSISIISSLSPITAIGPLIFVLIVSMIREGYEDYVFYLNYCRKDMLRMCRLIRDKPGGFVKEIGKLSCGRMLNLVILLKSSIIRLFLVIWSCFILHKKILYAMSKLLTLMVKPISKQNMHL